MWKEPNGYHHDHFVCGYDGKVPNREHNPTMMSSSAIALGYIQHPISKLDTLAGIAIKYGVQVADIKKVNGLVTDRQMFALKTLHIPLHGRHSNDHSPPDHASHELLESFQPLGMKSSGKKRSPAMNSSQGYYGTVPAMKESIREILEMTMSSQNGSSNSSENGSFDMNSPMSDRPQSRHKKSRSLAESNLDDIMEKSDKWNDALVKNLEADLKVTPELLLKQDNSNSCGLSSRTGKSLAQRQKAASRITLTTNAVTIGVGDAFIIDGVSGVRKSSSTSCLQGQGNNSSTYMRPTPRRSLKPDLIASTASIAKPILTGSRSKAALD